MTDDFNYDGTSSSAKKQAEDTVITSNETIRSSIRHRIHTPPPPMTTVRRTTTPTPTPPGSSNSLSDLANIISDNNNNNDNTERKKTGWNRFKKCCACMNSVRLAVLFILCLQNSVFTLLRRYSLGVLKEHTSKYEILFVAEVIKILYCIWMISQSTNDCSTSSTDSNNSKSRYQSLQNRLLYILRTSGKMFVLALIYGAMNVLSFVALRNIGAGIFTIFAQCKIISTATFSTIILRRKYTWTQWRALIALMLGVLIFSEPIWGHIFDSSALKKNQVPEDGAMPVIGILAVITEVSLSGFASIYFEKVIKTDPSKVTIWERNFQLAMGSCPVYILFILFDGGGTAGYMVGWSWVSFGLSALGAAGGLLVALSIKYGDSILKTLATTGAIVLSSLLDYLLLDGDLTPTMVIAGIQVIIAICNYTFDQTPKEVTRASGATSTTNNRSPKIIASVTTNSNIDEDVELASILEGQSSRATI